MKYTLGLINTQSLATVTESEPLSVQVVDEQTVQQADAFIIQPKNAANTLHWLRFLRQHASCFSAPIYVLGENTPLTDTNMPESTEAWLTHLHAMQEKQNSFVVQGADEPLERVLKYLWLDTNRCIQARQALDKPGGYEYPLLELWLGTHDTSAPLWLAHQEEVYLLKPLRIVDRTRSCRQCDSALLNYVDVCKQCHSIEIQTEKAIHCFTCGHVANERVFQRDNILSCPNCLTQLRHIGTDYDRPIENTRCQQCQSLSIDALVQAHCFQCGEANCVDELKAQNYYHYQLGVNAGLLITSGELHEAIPQQLREPIGKEHLAWLIEWLLAGPALEDKVFHQLIKIRINNYNALRDATSEHELSSTVKAFQEQVEGLVHEKNSCCRIHNDVLLYLFPASSEQGVE
ncbi:MAG: hypothetical protein KAG18_07310, partial [Sinobacterium sp.]|nr:hypothetical protein [Sinobacterium sp.]